MHLPIILNIQKYSIHDGEGIRTTVFFKGCLLNCWWCHNPESQSYRPEFMFNADRCEGCGLCAKACPHQAICVTAEGKAETNPEACLLCSECLDYCLHNNREIVGRTYEIDELVRILARDIDFYDESGGGVTLSGGEVMTQNIDYLEALCQKLKAKGIHIAIDTCGYAPRHHYTRLLPLVDTFLYDVKTLDDAVHQKYMGKSNRLILENLEYLADQGAHINLRIPVVVPVNHTPAAIEAIAIYVKDRIGLIPVNLLPYHNTGSSKYAKLGRPYPAEALSAPSKEEMAALCQIFRNLGFSQVKIGG